MSETKQVELTSKDKVSFKVDRDVILMSGLVKDMLEEGDEDETPIIPIPNVDSKPLQKVIEYCQYHHKEPAQEIEKPLKGKIEDVICDWDKKFLEIDQSLLIELIMAANYLNIKDLLDLTCAKVASMIKGKSPEQIREMFGIENDFTPEEEAKIREENKWCEEA
ncbi:S-phase kinase-associated protein [Naegleria gruberi]|uniref:S-phase kinase-associated protein n=1 Tax=Naegleria gruberi TaxID=5762 RepID=D2V315_NAEGR|nr:S-phase kinase-associated protein [Naegleria gruberi]EFC48551.1 S-phase kinase-associated protein [Naegleria gruberi]|eukprot:XP_002681295.1 S-phase kinase-associated protein [Naegleria gruberi strain NEG-M]